MGGTRFDIRAVIQLNSTNVLTAWQFFPGQCTNVPINQCCRRLHFLQAADAPAEVGAKLGAYSIHSADGQAHEIPIIYDQDVLTWLDDSGDANPPGPKPV